MATDCIGFKNGHLKKSSRGVENKTIEIFSNFARAQE